MRLELSSLQKGRDSEYISSIQRWRFGWSARNCGKDIPAMEDLNDTSIALISCRQRMNK